jgi:hypothetical protein
MLTELRCMTSSRQIPSTNSCNGRLTSTLPVLLLGSVLSCLESYLLIDDTFYHPFPQKLQQRNMKVHYSAENLIDHKN